MRYFIFGKYKYEYNLYLLDRKTISITVRPNLELIVKAPLTATDDKIEKFLKKKWLWIEKQLIYFKDHNYKSYPREYVSGEGFLYLGNQYRLIVRKAKSDKVKLIKKEIIIYSKAGTASKAYSKSLLKAWYREEIKRVFKERLTINIKLFPDYNLPLLTIREMKKRWGSFMGAQQVILNPKLIHTAEECIDYVIVHELCHMKYKNHGKNFFNLLNAKFPRWKKMKEKLESYRI